MATERSSSNWRLLEVPFNLRRVDRTFAHHISLRTVCTWSPSTSHARPGRTWEELLDAPPCRFLFLPRLSKVVAVVLLGKRRNTWYCSEDRVVSRSFNVRADSLRNRDIIQRSFSTDAFDSLAEWNNSAGSISRDLPVAKWQSVSHAECFATRPLEKKFVLDQRLLYLDSSQLLCCAARSLFRTQQSSQIQKKTTRGRRTSVPHDVLFSRGRCKRSVQSGARWMWYIRSRTASDAIDALHSQCEKNMESVRLGKSQGMND